MVKAQSATTKKKRNVADKKTTPKKKKPLPEKQKTEDEVRNSEDPSALSQPEQNVLNVFRKYLMTPGKMLCFGSADLESMNKPLALLATKGMLVAEQSRGGYSLTSTGFAAMKEGGE